jgi:glycine hydroxymethyltransferase
MGTPALTTRGFVEADFAKVAGYFDRAVTIAVKLKNTDKGSKMKGFKDMCSIGPSVDSELVQLRSEVSDFASSFPTVGFEEDEMDYQGEYNVDFVAA